MNKITSQNIREQKYSYQTLKAMSVYLLFGSCSLFEYHPYDTDLSDRSQQLNAKAIEQILQNSVLSDTITIIAISDSQRFYDELKAFVQHANATPADFVVLNGDITDFGLINEFEWVHEIMSGLNKPYLAVIGNHDLTGNGEHVYEQMYGDLNMTFIFNRYKFILLNSNSREYRFNGEVPHLSWLESQLSGNDFDKALVISHIAPFDGDFDPALESEYVSLLSASSKVDLSLHAHQHSFRDTIQYNDGIRYVISTSMDEKMYLVIKLFNDGFKMEKIYF